MEKFDLDRVCLGCISFQHYLKETKQVEKYAKWVKTSQDKFMKHAIEVMEKLDTQISKKED